MEKEILVLGCGNILFGDDGFGPEVVEYLQKSFQIPSNVFVCNTGLSVREILFNIILSEKKPKKIIIVDAVDFGKNAGLTFQLDVNDMPEIKCDDFSMHQAPTSNLLKELKNNCGVETKIIVVQIKLIPEEVSVGLTREVKNSIPAACKMIMDEIGLQ
ncbi:MAG: hydrogenase maturation protease [Bacteroidota bacterium]